MVAARERLAADELTRMPLALVLAPTKVVHHALQLPALALALAAATALVRERAADAAALVLSARTECDAACLATDLALASELLFLALPAEPADLRRGVHKQSANARAKIVKIEGGLTFDSPHRQGRTASARHSAHGPSWQAAAHAWPHAISREQTAPHVGTLSLQLLRSTFLPGGKAASGVLPHGQVVTFSGESGQASPVGGCGWQDDEQG